MRDTKFMIRDIRLIEQDMTRHDEFTTFRFLADLSAQKNNAYFIE